MNSDNLLVLKDDMIAFIEGHGMRYFPAVIPEDTPRVWWSEPNPDAANDRPIQRQTPAESWKDFVEMAKAAGAPMVCIGEDTLDRPTLELLSTELVEISAARESSGDEMERLDRLSLEVGKVGHIELAFAHQGILFVHETSTAWYRSYREMVETVDHLQELLEDAFDEMDEEQE